MYLSIDIGFTAFMAFVFTAFMAFVVMFGLSIILSWSSSDQIKVENYIQALSNCDILLSPYPDHSHLLAAPTKMLEAGACQMAIVTSESGSIGFPNDFVLVGKSKHDFVEKLLYLKDENTRKMYGKKLRQEIKQNYNADIEIKKLIALYNELL